MSDHMIPQTRLCYKLLLSIAVLLGQPCLAGEVTKVEVVRDGQTYRISIEALIDAPRDAVYTSLTDYAHLTRLSPAVKRSQLLDTFDERRHRMRLVTRLCVLVFCASLDQTQDMEQVSISRIAATIVPDAQGSEFKGGFANWRLLPGGDGTHLWFDAELQPDFWIPPLIGPVMLRHMLRREAKNTVDGLERVYRGDTGAADNPSEN